MAGVQVRRGAPRHRPRRHSGRVREGSRARPEERGRRSRVSRRRLHEPRTLPERTGFRSALTERRGQLMRTRIVPCVATLALVCALPPAPAQYPNVPKDVQRAEDERRVAYEKPEDEAWAKAQPELAKWADKGKPYVPGAAKP